MAGTDPSGLKATIASGLLSFPLTDFDAADTFDAAAYRKRVAWLAERGAAAIFAAAGAGEFFSLTAAEYAAVIGAATGVGVGVPVVAAAGYGTRMAIALVEEAERAGSDGILLLPPYLTEASQEGLFNHVRAICERTRLGVIIYNRANCRIRKDTLARLADACPNLIGFKDGIGDIEEIVATKAALGDRLVFINGMPTAEVYAQAYRGMGIPSYTSAIFNFIPKSAMLYHKAILAEDRAAIARFTTGFLDPYGRIRARQPGYAVSIIKAGADIVGRSAGQVRPPLSNLSKGERDDLAALIERLGPQE